MGLLTRYLVASNILQQPPFYVNDPDLVTQYPSTVTGTPTSTANPGPAVPFDPRYNANNTYLTSIQDPTLFQQLTENEFLVDSFNKTNLDIEDPGVDGGTPYRPLKDPTIYPITTTAASAIRGFYPFPSKPAVKYGYETSPNDVKVFTPQDTYLNYIENYI